MNPTTQAIVDRLPPKPILIPAEIASAFGMATAAPILDAIKRGKLMASTVGGKFYVSHGEAERYIASTEYKAQEA